MSFWLRKTPGLPSESTYGAPAALDPFCLCIRHCRFKVLKPVLGRLHAFPLTERLYFLVAIPTTNEFTWHESTIFQFPCLDFMWFYPFTENIIRWIGKHSLLLLLLLFFNKVCLARPDYFWISFHLLSWFMEGRSFMLKATRMFELERQKPSGFHSSWRTVYLCVVHHSTWIMLSNLCFIISLWLAQLHFSYVFLHFPSLQILFVMEMKLELNLCSQGENKAPEVETSLEPVQASKVAGDLRNIFLKVESIGKNGLWFNFSMKIVKTSYRALWQMEAVPTTRLYVFGIVSHLK